MESSISKLLAELPGPESAQWPDGQRFVQAFAHGSMKVELYAPTAVDPQLPHAQDELYFVVRGSAQIVRNAAITNAAVGDVFFVPAHMPHHFQEISPEFIAWVVFWGRTGGEAEQVEGNSSNDPSK